MNDIYKNTDNNIINDVSALYAAPFMLFFIVDGFSNLIWHGHSNISGADIVSNPIRAGILSVIYLFSALLLMRRNAVICLRIFAKSFWYLTLCILLLVSSMWSHYPDKVFTNWIHFIGITMIAFCLVRYSLSSLNRLPILFAIIPSMIVVSSIITVVIRPDLGIQSISDRWQGTTSHPNTLGIICLIAIWSQIL